MKHIVAILTILLLVPLTFFACTTKVPNDQKTEDSDGSNATSTPEIFNDIGKTLNILKNEHPKAMTFTQTDGFPDAAVACFGESESKYAYVFFGGQDGDFGVVMEKYEDQLKCSGVLTTTSILFPEMGDDMSFLDFFSLIGVSAYEYFAEDGPGEGWLSFTYNGMAVWLNTNEAIKSDGEEFAAAKRVKGSVPVIIIDEEIFWENQKLADAVMFE